MNMLPTIMYQIFRAVVECVDKVLCIAPRVSASGARTKCRYFQSVEILTYDACFSSYSGYHSLNSQDQSSGK